MILVIIGMVLIIRGFYIVIKWNPLYVLGYLFISGSFVYSFYTGILFEFIVYFIKFWAKHLVN